MAHTVNKDQVIEVLTNYGDELRRKINAVKALLDNHKKSGTPITSADSHHDLAVTERAAIIWNVLSPAFDSLKQHITDDPRLHPKVDEYNPEELLTLIGEQSHDKTNKNPDPKVLEEYKKILGKSVFAALVWMYISNGYQATAPPAAPAAAPGPPSPPDDGKVDSAKALKELEEIRKKHMAEDKAQLVVAASGQGQSERPADPAKREEEMAIKTGPKEPKTAFEQAIAGSGVGNKEGKKDMKPLQPRLPVPDKPTPKQLADAAQVRVAEQAARGKPAPPARADTAPAAPPPASGPSVLQRAWNAVAGSAPPDEPTKKPPPKTEDSVVANESAGPKKKDRVALAPLPKEVPENTESLNAPGNAALIRQAEAENRGKRNNTKNKTQV